MAVIDKSKIHHCKVKIICVEFSGDNSNILKVNDKHIHRVRKVKYGKMDCYII